MKYYCEEKEAVLRELCSKEGGLSSEEAAVRLEKNGKNRLKAAKGKSLIVRFLSQLADPMIIILLVAAAISGVLAVTQGELCRCNHHSVGGDRQCGAGGLSGEQGGKGH